MLRGVPVLGTMEDFETVVTDLAGRGQKPRHLIFTAPPSTFESVATAERLIEMADKMGMAVSRLNPATELRNTRSANAFELRPIELTDLLERPQAALDIGALHRFIHDRRVLVTGAGGSIGSELTRQVAALGPSQLIVLDNSEFNLYSIDLDLAESFAGVPRWAHLCDVRDANRARRNLCPSQAGTGFPRRRAQACADGRTEPVRRRADQCLRHDECRGSGEALGRPRHGADLHRQGGELRQM